MKNIGQPAIRALVLPWPDLEAQCKIADLCDVRRKGLAAANAELAKLTKLKSALMDDLLTGRVRVPVDTETLAEV
jgi:hypothetical protein